MTKDEALKMALEALEEINKLSIGEHAIALPAEIDTAMEAIRQALEKPKTMTATELAKRIKRGEKWKLAEQSDFDRIAVLEAEARRVFAESGGQIEALRQILSQLPAATKMIDKDLLEIAQEIISNAEEYEFDDGLGMGISMDLYNRLAAAIDADEPDTGTDRGAWDDVPDATKWVDELRGDEPEFECPRCGHCCWTSDDMSYRPGGLSLEKPPNSTTNFVEPEPIGEIVESHGLIAVSIPEMPPVGTKLYAAPPKRIWQSIRVDEVDRINDYVPVEPKQTRMLRLARAIEAKLWEKNT